MSDKQNILNILNWYKIQKCTFDRESDCPKRETCLKYHNHNDRRRNPFRFVYRSQKCPNPIKCEKGALCPLAHNDEEIYYHPKVYKMSKCNYFEKTGKCGWGEICSYAHGLDDFRTFEENCAQGEGVQNIILATENELKKNGISEELLTNIQQSVDTTGLGLKDMSLLISKDNDSVELAKLRESLSIATQENANLQKEHDIEVDKLFKSAVKDAIRYESIEKDDLAIETSKFELEVNKALKKYSELAMRIKCSECPDGLREFILVLFSN
ncbi:hypothetical protein MHBO_001231 [Bonamia ostreae]|uniref:C3H1-type domain-containing protein n=1 Tax=Bonamia ostreae TaxID=126728 RepID=A0ABV2AI93_9EUKA